MASRKILFFDIDGTLWDFNSVIPESTVRAIHAAQQNGHLCLINSGRSMAFIRDENLLGIGFDGIVSGAGTMIELFGEVKSCYELPVEQVESTLNTIRRYGFMPILEGKEYLYIDEDEFKEEPYYNKIMEDVGEYVRSIRDEWGRWEVSKLSCATEKDRAKQEACMEALKDEYEFMVHSSEVVEMSPKGYSKGTGIEKICEFLDADIADTFAFGDSVNDIPMLRAAGTAVVMGNGQKRAKQEADFVTGNQWEDGIIYACEHFGLI